MIGDRRDLLGGGAPAQLRAVPARDESQAVLLEDRAATRSRSRGNLPPSSMPAKPAIRASGEADLERNVAAQLRHVVVGPGDRVDAEQNGHAKVPREGRSVDELASQLLAASGNECRGCRGASRPPHCAGLSSMKTAASRRDVVAIEQDAEDARIGLDDAFLARHDDAVEPRTGKRSGSAPTETSRPTSWSARRAARRRA